MTPLVECRACGKPISPNAASCPNCGEPNGIAQKETKLTKSDEKQTATGCLAALLIGLIIGGILYWIITSS